MKKTLTRTLVLAIVVTVAIASFAFAAGPRGRGMGQGAGAGMGAGMGPAGFGMGPFGQIERMKEQLGLSDAQVTQIQAIFAEVRAQNATSREAVKGGLSSAIQLLLQNPNDVAAAQKALDEQFAAEKALKTNVLAATAKALNVLTADQRAEMAKMMAEHRTGRGFRRH